MSLWRSLLGFGRRNAGRAGALINLIETIAKRAPNRGAFRKAVVDAAEAGDLDFIFNELNAAKREADDFINNG